ncbi:hypothetical protein F0562_009866 [Nyssa sinensis]|uniref:Uncharacterized protein n=1 Tax=Nyssa sinensis TaxID=561372 RepID=A0A5J4ZX98_9ASTE|nr:hypothetical protein F0562_009866 [Nyssa sinensis]
MKSRQAIVSVDAMLETVKRSAEEKEKKSEEEDETLIKSIFQGSTDQRINDEELFLGNQTDLKRRKLSEELPVNQTDFLRKTTKHGENPRDSGVVRDAINTTHIQYVQHSDSTIYSHHLGNVPKHVKQKTLKTAMAFEPLLLLSFLFLCFWSRSLLNRPKSSRLVTNWPLVGMMPGVLRNAYRLHEFATELLEENGCTFTIRGPWFADMDIVLTCDPANIRHILSKNFSNYPKGPDFQKIFDVLGDGILNSESELLEFHRKTTMSLIHDAKFQTFLERTSWRTVEKVLVPALEHVSELGLGVDLQELFQRFTYDATCILTLGYYPSSHSINLPLKTFGDAEEAILFRHILPESWWKLQRWLQIGKEKQLSKAVDALDNFLAHCISLKREELLKRETRSSVENQEEEDFDLLTYASYIHVCKEQRGASATGNSDKFLRDTFLSLLFAGRDNKYSSHLVFLAPCEEPFSGNQDPRKDQNEVAFQRR